MDIRIFTIGHSTQSIAQFLQRIKRNAITAVADVRSAPYSRYNPHFNREVLRTSLKNDGINYVFLGKELGARTDDERCYVDNKVQYALLAQTDLFQQGIDRVIEGAKEFKIALMCAEKDPLECHRTILVARALVKHGHGVNHVLGSGDLETHEQAMLRLINQLGVSHADMFRTHATTLDEAYDKQADRIAYVRKQVHGEGYGFAESLNHGNGQA